MAATMTRRVSHSSIACLAWIACLALVLAMTGPGHAVAPKKPDPGKVDAKGESKPEARSKSRSKSKPDARGQSDVQQFCVNNAALLGDARIAFQTARLTEIETQIRQRLAELEAKKAEYEAWLRKRDEAMKQAADGVVAIYAKMRPEAAALQLAAMDDPVAAAILAKLPSRAAGAILNEMEPGRAARLTRVIADPDAAPDQKKS